MSTLLVAAPVVDVEPPPDPVSLDATRPEDIDTCVACDGYGAVLLNPLDPASVEDCRTCGGNGERMAS